MTDWATIAQVATAGGTLVLALATFSSIRASNRSVRLAERSMLAATRPVLTPSREDDPTERIRFGDGVVVRVGGHGGIVELNEDKLYMAISLRNGGAGLAVIHGWHVVPHPSSMGMPQPDIEDFRPQQRDLYVPADQTGFWQAAIRQREDPDHRAMSDAARRGDRVMVDILYSDYEGGQRAIARFGVVAARGPRDEEFSERCEVLRYWDLEGLGGRPDRAAGSA